MTEVSCPTSELILYQAEDGRTLIQCCFEGETLWLTQALIAELFPRNVRTINAESIPAEAAKTKAEQEYARCRIAFDVQPQAIDAEFEEHAKPLKRAAATRGELGRKT